MAERLKITKVENVKVLGSGEVSTVTLHLTAYHLILVQHLGLSTPNDLKDKSPRNLTRESWFAYSMISSCVYRPTPQGSPLQSSIRLRGRDFRFLTLIFVDDVQAQEVYESLKGATCKLGRIEKLYAFSYEPPPAERQINGWELYDERAEWKRQGISDDGNKIGWRISKINAEYTFSPTYPALLLVPASISDNTLNYAGRYRSRVRVPVLTYLHSVNNCSITRSSQPLAGLRGNRSIQDEKLVYACFSAMQTKDGEKNVTITSSTAPSYDPATFKPTITTDESLSEERLNKNAPSTNIGFLSENSHLYPSQQPNLIVDARPTVNAMAMQAVGLGSENMDHYKFATKVYLGIDNIHVMRESLGRVVEAIKDSDISTLPPNRERLAKSGWLKHITGLLEGSALIARHVGIQNSNVLIHCSDGWDRTSQLSALSQILLDPYYRTIDGFIVLIEKDWLAFGHMFQHRSGFLSSEKWFTVQNDALSGSVIQASNSGEGRSDAIEIALLSAKKFFNKNSNNQDINTDSEGEVVCIEDSPAKRSDEAAKETTKLKETSPVFHQFLDATYQLLYQYPNRFEFNERFLRRLLYHLYSCQYGTFLYNNEKSRLDARVRERTASVWDYFLSRRSEFTNKAYSEDEKGEVKERLLFPRLDKVRWWHEVFNRSDVEMNGHPSSTTERHKNDHHHGNKTSDRPEIDQQSNLATFTRKSPKSTQAGPFAGLREGIAGLGIGVGKGPKYFDGKQQPKVEM
ncbi:hypothetical protein K3495_g3256 [Podosphaera aphanis]|nr:hypothetical protein K3495_g3256 [Podosphaera aphanis]